MTNHNLEVGIRRQTEKGFFYHYHHQALYPVGKLPERESDYSAPGMEIKNAWAYTSSPAHFFMGRRSLSTVTIIPL